MSSNVKLIVIGILLAGCVMETFGECPFGYWGTECKLKCATGCRAYNSQRCNEDNGVCPRCVNGFYGPYCDTRCEENCIGCEQDTGVCLTCERTWTGEFCNERCPSNCWSCIYTSCSNCMNGYWGTFCENECMPNHECEHNCSASPNRSTCVNSCKCNSCYKDTGYCQKCAFGYWGEDCGRECPPHCYNNCNRYSGFCISCAASYWGTKCQYPCMIQNCLQCSYTHGYCTQCQNGKWGQRCEHECIGCDICKGYDGICTSCPRGYFGRQCEHECYSKCAVCHIQYGYCTTCSGGFWGQQCDKECKGCVTCHINTGNCEYCKPGKWGEECNRTCPDGCACCDIYHGHCNNSVCGLSNYDRDEHFTTKGPELASTKENMSITTTVSIAMMAVGILLGVICVTTVICMFRRLRINKARSEESTTSVDRKDSYAKARQQNANTNAENVNDSPVLEDEL